MDSKANPGRKPFAIVCVCLWRRRPDVFEMLTRLFKDNLLRRKNAGFI